MVYIRANNKVTVSQIVQMAMKRGWAYRLFVVAQSLYGPDPRLDLLVHARLEQRTGLSSTLSAWDYLPQKFCLLLPDTVPRVVSGQQRRLVWTVQGWMMQMTEMAV